MSPDSPSSKTSKDQTGEPGNHARPATGRDMPAIATMIEALQRLDLGLQGYPLREPSQMVADYLAELRQRVDDHDGELLVYELDGEIMGFIAGFGENDADLRVESEFHDYALIAEIYVRPNMRGLGVARALFSTFEKRMGAKGYGFMRIAPTAKNQGAIEAYLKTGFAPYQSVLFKKISG